MKKILGVENLSADELIFEIQKGARFVAYNYCISLLVVSMKRVSDIHFVRAGEGTTKGLKYTLLSLVAGWWGIPWGPIYTIQSVYKNSKGGIDVTQSVLNSMRRPSAAAAAVAK